MNDEVISAFLNQTREEPNGNESLRQSFMKSSLNSLMLETFPGLMPALII